jgi:hypothetical protein
MTHPSLPVRALHDPDHPSLNTDHAAIHDAQLDQVLVRQLGALPVLLPLCERLGLREVINARCYPNAQVPEDIDVGRVALVLILNRLMAPEPLVHVETWLADTVLPDLLELDAAQCNDDRLARVLDRLVPHLDALWQDLVVGAITHFGLDLRWLCQDLTSLSFTGAYEAADLVRYGYSRDHRPDRKQVELATTVTAAGGIPLDYRVLAGNVADRTTPTETLARVQRLLAALPPRQPGAPATVLVSDRAMLTLEALAAYVGSGLAYLGPLDPSLGDGAVRALLASVPAEELTATPLSYRPQRAADDPDWEDYHGVERPLRLPHPDPSHPPLVLRAVVVWSPGKARLDAQLRATNLTRLEQSLVDLAGKLGRRPYTPAAAVQRRLTTLLAHQPARRFLAVDLHGDGSTPAPLHLTWTHQDAVLAEAAALDGRYVLGTNLPTGSPTDLLTQAKHRDVPEKRFALVKGPLAVRPVFVHQQQRILGLVWCTMVALLLYALLEWEARRVGQPQTGQVLFRQAATLRVVLLPRPDGSILHLVTGLDPRLAGFLDRLGWPSPDRYAGTLPW